MKRLAMVAFLFGVLSLGCMDNHLPTTEGPVPPKTPPAKSGSLPITADQVNPDNTGEAVHRLDEELKDVPPRQGIQP